MDLSTRPRAFAPGPISAAGEGAARVEAETAPGEALLPAGAPATPPGSPRAVAVRRGGRRFASEGTGRLRPFPLCASLALHAVLFGLATILADAVPDRPPELEFQRTVPSIASVQHEETGPPEELDPLDEPPPEAADPSPETAVVVEARREELPEPEPEEVLEELPPLPALTPSPGFGPPPPRVRLRPEPVPTGAPASPPAPPRPPAAAPAPAAPASVASRAQSAVQRASGLSGNRAPAYPAEARMRGEQGTVRLEIEVDEQGAVTGVRILRSSGSPSLDEAARAAAEGWRFHPARRDGLAVRSLIERNITFQLRE